jgi:hypothetical protein
MCVYRGREGKIFLQCWGSKRKKYFIKVIITLHFTAPKVVAWHSHIANYFPFIFIRIKSFDGIPYLSSNPSTCNQTEKYFFWDKVILFMAKTLENI